MIFTHWLVPTCLAERQYALCLYEQSRIIHLLDGSAALLPLNIVLHGLYSQLEELELELELDSQRPTWQNPLRWLNAIPPGHRESLIQREPISIEREQSIIRHGAIPKTEELIRIIEWRDYRPAYETVRSAQELEL